METIYCRIIFQLTPRPLAGEGVSWAKKHKFKYDIISFLLLTFGSIHFL
jgi:hypothetical protein